MSIGVTSANSSCGAHTSGTQESKVPTTTPQTHLPSFYPDPPPPLSKRPVENQRFPPGNQGFLPGNHRFPTSELRPRNQMLLPGNQRFPHTGAPQVSARPAGPKGTRPPQRPPAKRKNLLAFPLTLIQQLSESVTAVSRAVIGVRSLFNGQANGQGSTSGGSKTRVSQTPQTLSSNGQASGPGPLFNQTAVNVNESSQNSPWSNLQPRFQSDQIINTATNGLAAAMAANAANPGMLMSDYPSVDPNPSWAQFGCGEGDNNLQNYYNPDYQVDNDQDDASQNDYRPDYELNTDTDDNNQDDYIPDYEVDNYIIDNNMQGDDNLIYEVDTPEDDDYNNDSVVVEDDDSVGDNGVDDTDPTVYDDNY